MSADARNAAECQDTADSAALSGAISELARDGERRRRLGEAGRRFVEQAFNRRTWAGRYLQILERTCRMTPADAVGQPHPSSL